MGGSRIVTVIVSLVIGVAVHVTGADRRVPAAVWPLWVRVTLSLLLLAIGLHMGMTPEVARSVALLGGQAAVFATVTAGMAFAFGYAAATLLGAAAGGAPAGVSLEVPGPSPGASRPRDRSTARGAALRLTWLAVTSVAAGFAFGAAAGGRLEGLGVQVEPAITVLLGLLLVAIGRDLAAEWSAVRTFILAQGWRLLVWPLAGAAGSLAGAWAAGRLMGLPPSLSLAIGGGFGWYSLTGVLVTHLVGPGPGALAFLANVLRETLTVLAAPALGSLLHPSRRWLAVLPGGATTMDTTLPVLAAATDAPTAAFAFAHGLLLTALVPFLVPLLLSL